MKLYIFIKRHDENTISKYPFIFEFLKLDIGITDKNITHARETFIKAWRDFKR
ncbi:unnamed protein product [marine sediment metagenome]|uniref:Uncharacterized protein n=1 Tax=marine sediment metagenome TaxID=412755 RepID=X1QEU5_9ZZZZ